MKQLSGIALLCLLTFTAFAQDDSRPKQPDLPGDLMVDFGMNLWSENPELLPAKLWGSESIGLYYNHQQRFNDHFAFHASLGFTFDKYSFDGQYTWLRDGDGVISLDTLSGSSYLTKNKLAATYLELPVEFRWHPLGTVNGEGWFIGLGGMAGYRIGSHTKIKFQNVTDEYKEKLYADFGLEQFRYGVQARFGFKTFHVFYKYYFNNVFDGPVDDTGIVPQTSTIGINFSGF
jgi:hypothetical protein